MQAVGFLRISGLAFEYLEVRMARALQQLRLLDFLRHRVGDLPGIAAPWAECITAGGELLFLRLLGLEVSSSDSNNDTGKLLHGAGD